MRPACGDVTSSKPLRLLRRTLGTSNGIQTKYRVRFCFVQLQYSRRRLREAWGHRRKDGVGRLFGLSAVWSERV